MFKEDLLADEEALDNFIHSVVVVVTKTDRKYDEYLSRTNNIAEFLAKRTDPESVLLVKMIENIVNNKRLFLFPCAQEGSFAPQCKLMEEMNRQQKNWQYYGWKKNNRYIQLPFKSQFRRLQGSEQDAFQREISFKQEIFELSCSILKNCILKASQKFKNNSIQYTEEFRQIQQLIQKYNTYGKFEFSKIERTKAIEPERNVSMLKTFKSLNQAVQIIYQVLELQEAQDLTGDGSGYLASIHQCQKKCRQLFAYFRDTLCSCEKEQTLFLNFAFLFLQAIIEFGNIYSIDNSRGADALQTIKDELNQLITGNTYSEAKYEFFVNFRTQSIEERQEVIAEILKLVDQDFIIKNDLKKSSTLMRKVIQLYINQAESFKNKGQHKKGIEMLLKAWSYVQREPSEQEENVKIFEERVEYFTYRIFSKVGECLLGLNLIDSAIQVFQKLKFVDKMNICYKKSFEKERDQKKKYNKMLEYGKFCEKYCRIQDALNLYQKMHDQFYFLFPTKKDEISNRIYECLGSEIKETYAEYKNTIFDKVKFDIQQEFIREIEIRVENYEDDRISEGNNTFLQEAYRNEDSIFEQQFIQNVEPVENSILDY